MPSQLTFDATEFLRNKLIVRNLPPYQKDGVFTPPPPPNTYEYQQSDSVVIDSPDSYIDSGIFANALYPINQFGPEGGFNTDGITLTIAQNASNDGPYNYSDADLLEISQTFLNNLGLNNIYSPVAGSNGGNYGFVYTTDTAFPQPPPNWGTSPYLPYWEPPSFRPSSYSPYEIVITKDNNAQGSEGTLYQDSRLAQDSAAALRNMLQYRVQQNLYDETLGRLNIIDALNDPTDFISILGGKTSLIQGNWQITRPQSLLGRGVDFLSRLAGTYYPSSIIPGDYFDEPTPYDFNEKTGLGKTLDYIGQLFGIGGRQSRTPSQLFLDNTGSAQKKQLAKTLELNRYRPSYTTNSAENPVGFVSRLLGVQFPKSNYYVGSEDRDPSFINSPPGQIPLDFEGKQVAAPVYGPDVLAKVFEGTDSEFKFGFAGTSTVDGGGVQGGMTWNSEKFGQNRGFKVGPGGEILSLDEEFNVISSQYDATKSTNYTFENSSILYNTQKIIDSQPPNANRFAHAGNAIDQVSKVFNDGYKEITKGSKVITYVSENGVEKGQEYCRIFTKDTPYLSYSDMQKSDGNIRKFSYSVLDNTFNLNIAPMKGVDSTNIENDGSSTLGHVKKYMFSIENLAWRTSSRPGYRYEDLPICERGSNGGRIMWFPPYDITFSEDVRAEFNNHTFLGRPEPVYTYKNTSRSGSLKWKIIVDHPSILNVIVNKVLSKESNKQRVDSILESFFSGCKKYDIYELAIKYPSIPISELQLLQSVINNPNSSEENVRDAYQQNTISESGAQNPSTPTTTSDVNSFEGLRIYFPFLPESTIDGSVNYNVYYDDYIARGDQYTIDNSYGVSFIENEVTPSFNKLNDLALKVYDAIKNKGAKNIKLKFKSAKDPDVSDVNDNAILANTNSASGRVGSIKQFFIDQTFNNGTESINLGAFITEKKLIIQESIETDDSVSTVNGVSNCINDEAPSMIERMACSSVKIDSIIVEMDPSSNTVAVDQSVETPPIQPTLFDQSREGISKRLLRNLLSECDYFAMVKEDNPMIYDSIQEKLKYFQPAFHSITPEGLNSRLTFLQQCMRPGDTIPTIGPDGTLKTTDALNTSFGAPPVLVIRVGDFFNTKIIPTSLGIRYEQLDLNPEGIGVQPMIAEISMGFNFIGGHGLKEPVQRLQNALSFNYYANTEMYDERATPTTPTEDTSALDKRILDAILNQVEVPQTTTSSIVNEGGATIGNIISSQQSTTVETGTISYVNIMDQLITQSQTYFDGSINGIEGVVKNYNYGILQLISDNRKYSTGTFGSTTTSIIGKSNKIQDNIDKLFNVVISDIENNDNKFFEQISNDVTVSSSQLRRVKKNYIDYLGVLKSSFTENLNNIINDMTVSQQDIVFTVDKLNFVTGQKTDGSIITNGDVKVYRLIVNNAYNTIISDYEKIALGVDDFHVSLLNNALLFNSYTPNNFIPASGIEFLPFIEDRREFMIISQVILTKLEEFIEVLSSGVDGSIVDYIRDYYTSLVSPYQTEQDAALTKVSDFKTNQQFVTFTPLTENPTERSINFQTTPATTNNKTSLINLYDGENSGNNNTYNGKISFL